MATKLHELLAIETNMKNQAGKTRAELMKTLKDKRHLFEKKLVTFKPNEEGAKEVTEAQSDIQTSLRAELVDWLKPILVKSLDTSFQIDVANTQAKADIITEEGATLLEGMPSTSLLRIEHDLQELHELIVSIPTLDPAKGFSADAASGKGVYKARETKTSRTKKKFAPIIIVPATKEHPAQVEKLYEDVPIGELTTQEWSALTTPAVKADLLDRVDKLTRAVKKARSRANEQEVDVKDKKIGEKLLDYILEPLVTASA